MRYRSWATRIMRGSIGFRTASPKANLTNGAAAQARAISTSAKKAKSIGARNSAATRAFRLRITQWKISSANIKPKNGVRPPAPSSAYIRSASSITGGTRKCLKLQCGKKRRRKTKSALGRYCEQNNLAMSDSRNSRNKPELVFGIVSAIGANLETIQTSLTTHLAAFGYTTNIHRVSKYLKNIDAVKDGLVESPEDVRLESYINAGNAI